MKEKDCVKVQYMYKSWMSYKISKYFPFLVYILKKIKVRRSCKNGKLVEIPVC
jgi:hypothetical protein